MGNSCRSVFPNTRTWEQQRMKDKETDQEGKKGGVSVKRSKAGTKEKRSPDGPKLSKSKHKKNKHNLLVLCKRWKKYNEIQLTNNKMDLNNLKITNHPPSAGI